MHYPRTSNGERKELRPHYNRAGALERVELDGATFVEHIAYNAKGQRTLIAYGNGVMTRYAYDPQTFRLCGMRTERYTQAGDAHLPADGRAAAGLRLRLRPRRQHHWRSTTARPAAASPTPPLGRMRSTGPSPTIRSIACSRPRAASATPAARPPWDDAPRCTDLTAPAATPSATLRPGRQPEAAAAPGERRRLHPRSCTGSPTATAWRP